MVAEGRKAVEVNATAADLDRRAKEEVEATKGNGTGSVMRKINQKSSDREPIVVA